MLRIEGLGAERTRGDSEQGIQELKSNPHSLVCHRMHGMSALQFRADDSTASVV